MKGGSKYYKFNICEAKFTTEEFRSTIKELKCNKATGIYVLQQDCQKDTWTIAVEDFYILINKICAEETIIAAA